MKKKTFLNLTKKQTYCSWNFFQVAVSALVASAVVGPAVLSQTVNGLPLGYAGAYAGAYAPGAYAGAYAPAVAAAPYVAPYSAPAYTGSQFHAQDEFGNLNYGYSNLNSAKQEVGNTYGGVQGGYSYVDANGALQQVQYVADAAGFRVADSRLPVAPVYDGVAPTFNPEPLVAPVDTAEVAEAKAAFAKAFAAQEAAVAAVSERKKREADPAFAYGFATHHPYAYGYPTYGYAGHAGFAGYAGLPYYG